MCPHRPVGSAPRGAAGVGQTEGDSGWDSGSGTAADPAWHRVGLWEEAASRHRAGAVPPSSTEHFQCDLRGKGAGLPWVQGWCTAIRRQRSGVEDKEREAVPWPAASHGWVSKGDMVDWLQACRVSAGHWWEGTRGIAWGPVGAASTCPRTSWARRPQEPRLRGRRLRECARPG